jgi:hypothetical protein
MVDLSIVFCKRLPEGNGISPICLSINGFRQTGARVSLPAQRSKAFLDTQGGPCRGRIWVLKMDTDH